MTQAAWAVPTEKPVLGGDDVHVWRIPLQASAEETAALERLLSPDERTRADRFRMVHDRRRFTVCRGALRSLLGQYLGVSSDSLGFDYGARGKPSLARPFGTLAFNLSHSVELGLIAIRDGGEVGVDVECVRQGFEWEAVARRFFHTSEMTWLRHLPLHGQADGFFRLWTRKEAFLKARGEGIWRDLHRFDVSLSPPKPVQEDGARVADQLWFLQDLEPGDGYKASLATCGPIPTVRTWQWPGVTASP